MLVDILIYGCNYFENVSSNKKGFYELHSSPQQLYCMVVYQQYIGLRLLKTLLCKDLVHVHVP